MKIETDLLGEVVQSRFSKDLFKVRGVYLNPPGQVKRVVLICANLDESVRTSLQEFGLDDVAIIPKNKVPLPSNGIFEAPKGA